MSGSQIKIKRKQPQDKIVALAGNPNVGKSTLFNNLTGMRQHTGNWPGKTVATAKGVCRHKSTNYVLIDLPGAYSLSAHSAEEEVARDFILFGNPNAVIVVCDATCLERNLNLALQTIEIADKVLVCVNLMDEAKKKGISIDLETLSQELGVPVAATMARKKKTLSALLDKLDSVTHDPAKKPLEIPYRPFIKEAIQIIKPSLINKNLKNIKAEWLCLKLLENDQKILTAVSSYLGFDIAKNRDITKATQKARGYLAESGQATDKISDLIVSDIIAAAESINNKVIKLSNKDYNQKDKKIDRIVTNKWTGIPIMIALLSLIFWLTIAGANYPSKLLSTGLFWIGDRFSELLIYLNCPLWLHDMLILGVYRVLAWVVSVMLPPMAIFFPLFTFLEDLGYLPRVAFNLDKYFKKCSACGKQALTMCMGFGCNAVGVAGARIIDSPRERLIAILTNAFVPCNGRFPTLIAVISMFFISGIATGFLASVYSALMLTAFIVFGVVMTFFVSKFLSKTFLKGIPSSFILELPPYRKPQPGKILVRSVFDRTLFVLGRAVMVAAPAGLIIWALANVQIDGVTLLKICSSALDPLGYIMGMDGVILMGFILSFPANEILIPIIIMAYMSTGSITELESLAQLKDLFIDNGWTWITAICVMLFCLFHWPCSTTCLTIKKETGSLRWTALSIILPTVIGMTACMLFANAARLIMLLL